MGCHTSRQTEVDVIMDLNEQGQEQLRVDAPHSAHAAVDGQELTQTTGCLQAEGRLVGCPGPSSQHPWQGMDCFSKGQTWIFALLWPSLEKSRSIPPGPLHPSSWLTG